MELIKNKKKNNQSRKPFPDRSNTFNFRLGN